MKRRRTTPLETGKTTAYVCSIELRHQMLHKVPFFSSLSDDELIQVNKLFHHKSCIAGQSIYFTGDDASQLFVVLSGNVKLIKHSREGQDVLIEILNPGDFLGTFKILGDDKYRETAVAHTDSCILSISSVDFQLILDKIPSVAINLIKILSERLISSNAMIQQLSVKSVEKRIAYILIKLKLKLGVDFEKGTLIQLPLSRNDLAEMTGSTPETVSRIMSNFAKNGIIRTGRKWISITDYNKLSRIADI